MHGPQIPKLDKTETPMIRRIPSLACLLAVLMFVRVARSDDAPPVPPQVLVVVGAGGSEEYQTAFATWADRWKSAAGLLDGASYHEIGREEGQSDSSDKDRLNERLSQLSDLKAEAVWIVLIGHGTFDGKAAKFNLRGPDVSAEELNGWIEPMKSPLIVVNCASASGPFINRLSAAGRTIVTATKSGQEQNFARFGDYLSQAISNIAADLDHDDEVSLLEAFLSASDQVAKFYEAENRIATEHALIDDSGDRLGTPATMFQGTTAVAVPQPKAARDGGVAARRVIFQSPQSVVLTPAQRESRAAIEAEIDRLKLQKSELATDQYFAQLEPLMLQLAELYAAAEAEDSDESQRE